MTNESKRKLEEEREYLKNLIDNPSGTYSERVQNLAEYYNKDNAHIIHKCSFFSLVAFLLLLFICVEFKIFSASEPFAVSLAFLLYAIIAGLNARIILAVSEKKSGNAERKATHDVNSAMGWHIEKRLENIEEKLKTSD